MAGNSVIGALRVMLGLDSAQFESGARRVRGKSGELTSSFGTLRGSIGALGTALASALAGGAALNALNNLRDMTRAAVDSAGAIGEQAQQLGVTTDALQEYRYAATQVGLSAEEMDTALAQLTRRVGDAAGGTGAAAAAFTRLGINLRDAQGRVRATADLIPEIADALQRLPTEADRAAVAVDLFGRSGQKLAPLLSGGAAGVREFTDAAHELGVVLSSDEIAAADSVADQLAALNYQIEAQQNRKLLENADALLQFESAWADLKLGAIGAITEIQDFVERFDLAAPLRLRVAGPVEQTIAAVRGALDGNWRAAWGGALAAVEAILPGVGASLAEIVNGMTTFVNNVAATFRRLEASFDWVREQFRLVERAAFGMADKIVFRSWVPDMVDLIGQHFARLQGTMVNPAMDATMQTEQAFSGMAQNVLGSLQGLAQAIKNGGFLDIVSSALGLGQQLGLFGTGGGGFSGGSSAWASASAVPGFASGGSGVLGGFSGIDRNLLSLNGSPIARVSAGEMLRVTPANDRASGGTVVNNYYTLPSDEFWGRVDGRADRRVGEAAPGIARMGSQMAQADMARREARRLT
jgi:hypothetical protein